MKCPQPPADGYPADLMTAEEVAHLDATEGPSYRCWEIAARYIQRIRAQYGDDAEEWSDWEILLGYEL